MQSRIQARNRGRPLDVLGAPMIDNASGADLGGGAAVFVCRVAPEAGPPAHYHQHTDEFFYLLEGQLDVWIGGRRVKLWPGMSATLPRSVVHRHDNLGERPAKVLIVVTPAEGARFFDDIDRDARSSRGRWESSPRSSRGTTTALRSRSSADAWAPRSEWKRS